MTRLGVRRDDAYREKITIPVTSEMFAAMKRIADRREEKMTRLAREMLRRGIEDETAVKGFIA